MKNLLVLIFWFLAFSSFSQLTNVDPDTVCYQSPGSIYQIPNTLGYTYTWTVNPSGSLISGQGTNQIQVDWSSASTGLIIDAVSVFATSANGCQSSISNIDVFVLLIEPIITSIGPFCPNEPCVNLISSYPGGIWSGPGVSGSQFCSALAGSGNHSISYQVTVGGCQFISNITVVVDPTLLITPIFHN